MVDIVGIMVVLVVSGDDEEGADTIQRNSMYRSSVYVYVSVNVCVCVCRHTRMGKSEMSF